MCPITVLFGLISNHLYTKEKYHYLYSICQLLPQVKHPDQQVDNEKNLLLFQ